MISKVFLLDEIKDVSAGDRMELMDFCELSILLGYYKNLLSEKQKEYMIDHFEMDYSLSEIGKKHGVSRQAVYENIKRGIVSLREYEEKLGFYARDIELKKALERLKESYSAAKLEEIIQSLEA